MYGFGSISNEDEIWTSVGNPIGDLIIKMAGELNEHNTYHRELLKKADQILQKMDWEKINKIS